MDVSSRTLAARELLWTVLPGATSGVWLRRRGWYAVLGVVALVVLLLLVGIAQLSWRMSLSCAPQAERSAGQNLEGALRRISAAEAEHRRSPAAGRRRAGATAARRRCAGGQGIRVRRSAPRQAARPDPARPGRGSTSATSRACAIWPMQLSYEGFTKHLHRNTIIPEGEQPACRMGRSIAGRAKLDDCQVMLGLGLEALKPTTIGRKTIDVARVGDDAAGANARVTRRLRL